MSMRHILREVAIERTVRVQQAESLFDVSPAKTSRREWTLNIDLPDTWHVGAIVGPSGAGKSTLAREMFADHLLALPPWPPRQCVLDAFPASMGVKEVVDLMCSVGFSSPPSWMRPWHCLSTGEQFRVGVALGLALESSLLVVDEFTSTVDRTVAQVASAAIAKAVRRRAQRFVAVTCHYDVLDWLQPDWVFEPHLNRMTSRGFLQRPLVELVVRRVHHDAWKLFAPHHYLSGDLNTAARCFVAFWRDRAVAFASVIHQMGWGKREHRVVCLPDFQGLGIGHALSELMGAMCRGIGERYMSITSHPGMKMHRTRSPLWKTLTAPAIGTRGLPKVGTDMLKRGKRQVPAKFIPRLRGTYEYTGPALPAAEARDLWGQPQSAYETLEK